jgi:hypothetical protein
VTSFELYIGALTKCTAYLRARYLLPSG